jgi:hypothetical protein
MCQDERRRGGEKRREERSEKWDVIAGISCSRTGQLLAAKPKPKLKPEPNPFGAPGSLPVTHFLHSY